MRKTDHAHERDTEDYPTHPRQRIHAGPTGIPEIALEYNTQDDWQPIHDPGWYGSGQNPELIASPGHEVSPRSVPHHPTFPRQDRADRHEWHKESPPHPIPANQEALDHIRPAGKAGFERSLGFERFAPKYPSTTRNQTPSP